MLSAEISMFSAMRAQAPDKADRIIRILGGTPPSEVFNYRVDRLANGNTLITHRDGSTVQILDTAMKQSPGDSA